MAEPEISGLSFIEVKDPNPFALFNEWKNEADNLTGNNWFNNSFCFATTSPDGQPKNRYALVKKIDDGFTFATDKRGNALKDIEVNPRVGGTFVWHYTNGTVPVIRQVRIEGTIYLTDNEMSEKLYDSEPPYSKIRSHLCHQGLEVNWDELKLKHDELMKQYPSGEIARTKPDHYVGLKIIPHRMEFYYGEGDRIADRILFRKNGGTWKYVRLAP